MYSGVPTRAPVSVSPIVNTKEKPPKASDGYFDHRVDFLHFYARYVTRNTLPLSSWHFYPSICPLFMIIHRLSRCIRAFTSGASRRDRGIAKYRYLNIVVLHAFILGSLRIRQHLGLVAHFPLVACTDDLVRQERSHQVRIICF